MPEKETPKDREFRILLIEDNPGDIQLIKRALQSAGVLCELTVIEDGAEAFTFLERLVGCSFDIYPHLVLLDLNLPKKDGREVLRFIKEDKKLRHLPVAVLTSSDSERDTRAAYELHANCYVVKPVRFQEWVRIIRNLKKFWLDIVKRPGG